MSEMIALMGERLKAEMVTSESEAARADALEREVKSLRQVDGGEGAVLKKSTKRW